MVGMGINQFSGTMLVSWAGPHAVQARAVPATHAVPAAHLGRQRLRVLADRLPRNRLPHRLKQVAVAPLQRGVQAGRRSEWIGVGCDWVQSHPLERRFSCRASHDRHATVPATIRADVCRPALCAPGRVHPSRHTAEHGGWHVHVLSRLICNHGWQPWGRLQCCQAQPRFQGRCGSAATHPLRGCCAATHPLRGCCAATGTSRLQLAGQLVQAQAQAHVQAAAGSHPEAKEGQHAGEALVVGVLAALRLAVLRCEVLHRRIKRQAGQPKGTSLRVTQSYCWCAAHEVVYAWQGVMAAAPQHD